VSHLGDTVRHPGLSVALSLRSSRRASELCFVDSLEKAPKELRVIEGTLGGETLDQRPNLRHVPLTLGAADESEGPRDGEARSTRRPTASPFVDADGADIPVEGELDNRSLATVESV
jgi:hypothetical protein